jgi:hypothetical protein
LLHASLQFSVHASGAQHPQQTGVSNAMSNDSISVADILGPWVESDWQSGLIDRCRQAWNKPLRDLTREELATLLRQRIAVEHVLPIAKRRLQSGVDDDTEIYDGELEAAIEYANNAA